MKKTAMILCMMIIIATGCASNIQEDNNVNNEILSAYGEETNDDYLTITKTMNNMGILGTITEGKASEEMESPLGLIKRGADYYVVVTEEDGDEYYGAIIDGEISIWQEKTDKSMPSDGEEINGNVRLMATVCDGFSGEVTLTAMDITSSDSNNAEDYSTYTIVLNKENGYQADVDLENGAYVIYDYDLGKESSNYYLIDEPFTVEDDQQIVNIQIEEL